MLTVGDTVDLNDQNFGWRGAYVITKDYGDGKVQIVNTATKSKQVVSVSRLRKGRLAPFSIKTLKP